MLLRRVREARKLVKRSEKERRGHRRRLSQRYESEHSRSTASVAQLNTTLEDALVNKDSNYIDCIPNRVLFVL